MAVNEDSFETKQAKRCNRRPIRSIAEFIDYVEYLQEHWEEDQLWYRGVSKSVYRLTPSIYRSILPRQLKPDIQEEMLAEFIRRSKAKVPVGHANYEKWEWYHSMQHYGVPTRQLDWTDGSLFGLYFAVRNLQSVTNPAVWILNPFWLNEVSAGFHEIFSTESGTRHGEFEKIKESYITDFEKIPELPIAVAPPHINERITAQRSYFTIHGSDREGFYRIFRENEDTQLVQLKIDGQSARTTKDTIIAMGIRESTIFPDLEGLARELVYEYELC